jgi:hypothetical protein
MLCATARLEELAALSHPQYVTGVGLPDVDWVVYSTHFALPLHFIPRGGSVLLSVTSSA